MASRHISGKEMRMSKTRHSVLGKIDFEAKVNRDTPALIDIRGVILESSSVQNWIHFSHKNMSGSASALSYDCENGLGHKDAASQIIDDMIRLRAIKIPRRWWWRS